MRSADKVGPYADFFPGHDVVDVLATDVYSSNFAGHDYEDLQALAEGKPIALWRKWDRCRPWKF